MHAKTLTCLYRMPKTLTWTVSLCCLPAEQQYYRPAEQLCNLDVSLQLKNARLTTLGAHTWSWTERYKDAHF